MAYTSTPEQSTHQLRRLPIIGGETIASNVLVGTAEFLTPVYQGQRYINCYPKRLELVNTDDKWVLTKCPPIISESKTFTGSGTDPIRCVSTDGAYIWKGRRLYLNDFVPTLVYTDANDLFIKSMYVAVNPSGTDILYCGILKDNTLGSMHSFTFNASTNTFTKSAAVTFLENSNEDPFQSVFFNGRLFSIGNNKRLYNTPPGNYLTWNSTNFIVPEYRGDDLVAITLYKNYLVAFSTASIEFFQDGAVEIGSPLVRQDAYIQLFGVKAPINITQTGDNVFFLSYEDRFGYGLYTFDNFTVKKVSNFYVDTLLNNEDITADSPFSTKLWVVDFYGDPCMIFNSGFANALYVENVYVDPVYVFEISNTRGYPYIAYSTKHRQWFDFSFSNSTAYDWSIQVQNPGFIQLAPNNLNGQWKTYFVGSYAASGVVNWYYFTKDYNPATGSLAEVVFDITDFGANRWKHIKYVDAVGDFGNNTVALSWTPNSDYSNWSAYVDRTQSTLGPKNAIRWPNLGRHRQSAFRVRFSGNSNIKLDGLEVNYNLGTN